MGAENVISLIQQTLLLVLWVSSPVLLAAAVVGLMWSIFQAVTQLQDQASAFAVKLIAVTIVIALTSGWAGGQIKSFAEQVFESAQGVGI
jgi:type III secretion protein S